ncbi:uncharacterized protein EMH_0008520 [Eimeria mitis]|uniref:Uncharacterized protein n=1 Tax=Eimeria mitis TaxID=44415 RepID=U6K702_9EIME|nr:uncharacterized protein EMH_0008520 [Eimeria mitis]CDJ31253.1 hypothetical protein, conserved [Eimeria mitis]
MRQEPSDYSPGLRGAPVTDQDAAKSPAGGKQAQREIHSIGRGAGPPAGFSEDEKAAVPVSRATKKKVPALLTGALLAFLAAGALGGYLLNAKRGERDPPPIETPTPATLPTGESAAEGGSSLPSPAPTGLPTPADVSPPTQFPTSPQRPEVDVDETVKGAATKSSKHIPSHDKTSPKKSAETEGEDAPNYMPKPVDDSPTDPLEYFRRQASLSKKDAQVRNLTGKAYESALVDVQFVRTLLRAATSRIELLCDIEKLCNSSGIGSLLLGRGAAPLPSPDVLEKYQDRVTFEDFMVMLKGVPFRVKEKALEEAGTVARVLAERLAASVKLETMQLENDRKVHSSFQEFALTLPPGEVHIVHAKNVMFGVSPLLSALGRAIFDREANTLDAEALGSWVADWDTEGVLGRIAVNEEDMQAVLGMRLRNYPSTSPDDIFASALALF